MEGVRGGFGGEGRSRSFEGEGRWRRWWGGGLGRWLVGGCRRRRGRCGGVEMGGIVGRVVVVVVVVGWGGEGVVWIGRRGGGRGRRIGDWSGSRDVGWVEGVAAEGWIVCVDIGRSRVVLLLDLVQHVREAHLDWSQCCTP